MVLNAGTTEALLDHGYISPCQFRRPRALLLNKVQHISQSQQELCMQALPHGNGETPHHWRRALAKTPKDQLNALKISDIIRESTVRKNCKTLGPLEPCTACLLIIHSRVLLPNSVLQESFHKGVHLIDLKDGSGAPRWSIPLQPAVQNPWFLLPQLRNGGLNPLNTLTSNLLHSLGQIFAKMRDARFRPNDEGRLRGRGGCKTLAAKSIETNNEHVRERADAIFASEKSRAFRKEA